LISRARGGAGVDGRRKLTITREIKEVGSGAKTRPQREELLKAARRREIDVIIVWRLDRWGRSLTDLVAPLKELTELGIGFISINEALDLITPSGRAMAGMPSVFAEFERDVIRERMKAGIAQASAEGERHGRPPMKLSIGVIHVDVHRKTFACLLSLSYTPRHLAFTRFNSTGSANVLPCKRGSRPC